MPVYAMSCFRLTKSTISNLTSAICDFWWNTIENKNKIHWVSWEKLCLSKECGGLGFRDLECFNQALLAKQAWRLIQEPSCLFAQVLKSKYYPDHDFSESGLSSRPSYGWRSIQHGKELLFQGLSKQICNGESFFVWTDPWLYDEGWRAPYRRHNTFNLNLRVSDIIDVERRGWKAEQLYHLFLPEDVQRIKKIKPVVGKEDFWTWDHTKSGEYSVKSGNWLANQNQKEDLILLADALPSLNGLKNKVWSLLTVPKIKVFIWRVLSDALPVVDLLKIRGLKGDTHCQICGLEGESINHVLFTCTFARQMWALSRFHGPKEGFDALYVHFNFFYLLQVSKKVTFPLEIRRLFPWILWRIWKNRNFFLFEGKLFPQLETQRKIEEDAEEWFFSQEIHQKVETQNERFEIKGSSWLPPPHDWLKCNVEEWFFSQEINQEVETQNERFEIDGSSWLPPPHDWLKCNVGFTWIKKKRLLGAGWILRDKHGKVTIHSRRSFAFIDSRIKAKLCVTRWAIEDVGDLKISKVIFAVEPNELVGAVNRPKAWPSFGSHSEELLACLSRVNDWRMVVERSEENRGVSLITQSATKLSFLQSYVALGAPDWLSEFFENERPMASVF
ncbi:putative mitochondrial protein [Cardamine amara subsp. amara]|uniref:Mitochondrial protein n=1 Tax=Cardamine amara subsp. amara TaxID=228776 RepID=A0ABD1C7F3_CARAN